MTSVSVMSLFMTSESVSVRVWTSLLATRMCARGKTYGREKDSPTLVTLTTNGKASVNH